MKISVLTLFPEFIETLRNYSIIGRAIGDEIVDLKTVNIRDFATNRYLQVDDYPYGGGPGMLMQPGPIVDAIESLNDPDGKVYYLSPQGRVLTQEKLKEMSNEDHIILLNGHYEGIDNRVVEHYVDEEISIGDYVLTGGEIPTMVLIDGIVRLLPGVLKSEESYEWESHYGGLLEHPQYTRPQVFRDLEVPEILLSGNHEEIRKYRLRESIRVTLKKRPDLINTTELNEEAKKFLDEIMEGGI